MLKIIYEKIKGIEKDTRFLSPQFPPNNIKKLKEIYSLTDIELANKLGIETGFLSSVANNRATFSGSTTIKLLKELDVSFSTVYNIASKVKVPCENFTNICLIVSSNKNYENSLEVRKLVAEILSQNFGDKYASFKADFATLSIINNKLDLKEENFYEKPEKSRLNFYESLSEDISNININVNENMYYYLIGAEGKNYIELEKNIDTLKTLDKETTNLLNSFPFKKIVNIAIPNDYYKVNGDRIILDKPYTIIRNNTIQVTDTLYKDDYVTTSKEIIFKSFSSEDTINKFKLYRKIMGYSMEYMADIFNISRESYRLLEIGHNKMTTYHMWKVENSLGILLENIVDIDAYNEKFNKKI